LDEHQARTSMLKTLDRLFDATSRSWMVRDVLWPFLITRVGLLAVGVFAMSGMKERPSGQPWHLSNVPFLDIWGRWDTGWFLSIARRGYSVEPLYQQYTNLPFFPLYPQLMRVLTSLVPNGSDQDFLLAGVIISNVCLLVALVFLRKLVLLDFDDCVARRTLLYLLVFPTSFYFSAVYSESLFVMLTVMTFYYARKDTWWLAGLCGGLSALTRSVGVFVLVPIAYVYLESRQFKIGRIDWSAAALLLIPLGLAPFSIYLYQLTGDPFAFAAAHAAWGRQLTAPPALLGHIYANLQSQRNSFGAYSPLVDVLFTVGPLGVIGYSLRCLKPYYLIFALYAWLVPILSGSLLSMPRCVLIIFPLFISLGIVGRHQSVDTALVVISSLLSGLFMAMFSLWYWVA
jgi:Gpi18-like mannosyltransferase